MLLYAFSVLLLWFICVRRLPRGTRNPSKSSLVREAFDVFVSYPHAKKHVVHHLIRLLVRAGLKVWVDEQQMKGNIYEAMNRGIMQSCVVLACVCTDYEASTNCMRELCRAADLNKPLVVVRLDNYDMRRSASAIPLIAAGKLYTDVGSEADVEKREVQEHIFANLRECGLKPSEVAQLATASSSSSQSQRAIVSAETSGIADLRLEVQEMMTKADDLKQRLEELKEQLKIHAPTQQRGPINTKVDGLDVDGVVALLKKWGLHEYEAKFREKQMKGTKLMSHVDAGLLEEVVPDSADRR